MDHTPFLDWYPPFAYFLLQDQVGQPLSYRFSWSMNLSFPRQVLLDQNLLFHEDWAVIGSEDVELGRRWTSAGHDLLYEPRAWGEHYHPHDMDSASRLQESIGRGLRDLDYLVQDPSMLEAYGIFTWNNSPIGVLRGPRPTSTVQPRHDSDAPPLARRSIPAQPARRLDVPQGAPALHQPWLPRRRSSDGLRCGPSWRPPGAGSMTRR